MWRKYSLPPTGQECDAKSKQIGVNETDLEGRAMKIDESLFAFGADESHR